MPELQAVDHDPFAARLEPVDHDPFAMDEALSRSMTHYPESPNPAAPYVQGTKDFLTGGILQTLRGQGVQLPEWANRISDVAQSEPFNAAIGMATPFAKAGELGSAGANLLENQINSLSKTERFNWPVKLSYGKTIDMPVSVNPSRSMIQRELAQAPHGDVRALRAPNGDVYLWPANEAMHVDIADTFDLPFKTRQELQKASYLFNKADVDKLDRFKNFDDLISKLGSSADQPLQRDVLARGRSGRPLQTAPLPIGNENAILEAGVQRSAPANPPSIAAYHGSPHDFDKFDLSKIGTGEGSQAYGHGLYFAENEGVARSYRDQLGGGAMLTPGAQAAHFLDQNGGNRAAALKEMKDILKVSSPHPQTEALREAIGMLERGETPSPGRMYQVAIKAGPEHFLDWDKPLSEQSPKVRDALKGMNAPDDLSVSQLVNEHGDALRKQMMAGNMAKYKAGNFSQKELNQTNQKLWNTRADALVTEALRSAGIPGIKYLDQGSRSAGEGSRNYVVFDDKLIDILKKYGLAGLVAGSAYHLRTQQVDHDPFERQ